MRTIAQISAPQAIQNTNPHIRAHTHTHPNYAHTHIHRERVTKRGRKKDAAGLWCMGMASATAWRRKVASAILFLGKISIFVLIKRPIPAGQSTRQ
jgi:hypothetical protein